MLSSQRLARRAARNARQRAPQPARRSSVAVRALFGRKGPASDGEDPGADVRSTARRFGGPSQAGNDAIAEVVRVRRFLRQRAFVVATSAALAASRVQG